MAQDKSMTISYPVWYRVQHWNGGRFAPAKIEEVEVIKETEKTIWLKNDNREDGVKHLKFSDDYSYFESRDDAIKLARKMAKERIKHLKGQLREFTDALETFR